MRYKWGECRACVLARWNANRIKNPVRDMLRQAKVRAKQKGMEFSVSVEDIEKSAVCPLLGIELKYDNKGTYKPNSATLDRIDNSRGYVKGNVWIVSYRANSIKTDASVGELIALTKNLSKRIGL